MKKTFFRSQALNTKLIWQEAPEAAAPEPIVPAEAIPVDPEQAVLTATEAATARGATVTPEIFRGDPEAHAAACEIEGDCTHLAEVVDAPLTGGSNGADVLVGQQADDTLTPETGVVAPNVTPLNTTQIESGFTQIRNQAEGMAVSPEIEAEVRASFESEPFNTEGLTEAEIQEEIQVRVISAKAEAIRNRPLTAGVDGAEPVTEGDYLAQLAEAQGLDPETLLIARARNQAGIGAEVDTTGAIEDPEAYQAELEAFTENYAAAQAYLEANADIAPDNPLIQARALAIMNGADPATIDEGSDEEDQTNLRNLTRDLSLGEGASPVARMISGDNRSINNMGSGIGTIPLDPADLDNVPALDQQTYEPGSEQAQQLFAEAARSNGMPEEWGASEGLHSILERESNGIVGRLNYTFGPVAERMGTDLNDPQFMSWAHQRMQEGATAGDFGIRSTACGLGQCIRANVEAYYPSGYEGVGDPIEEAAGMLGYIQERYGTPDEAFRQYGVHHEGY